jgi:hypothetical protein
MRIKIVQVAIQDPAYADSIRKLLLQDGLHWVYMVDQPDLRVEGVIVMDAARLDDIQLLQDEQKRLVVLVRKEGDDLSKIWDAGIRHVVFQGDPPHTARVAVLGVELTLGSSRPGEPESYHPKQIPAESRSATTGLRLVHHFCGKPSIHKNRVKHG